VKKIDKTREGFIRL